MSEKPKWIAVGGMFGSWASEGTCSFSSQPHLQREPAAERPFVLQEQADVVHRRLAGDDDAAVGQEVVAHDRVVAVRSRNAIELLPPEQVDHVARQARERVDPDAIELHAALYLVPAGRGKRDRPVYLEAEMRPARTIAAEIRRHVRGAARMLELGRNAGDVLRRGAVSELVALVNALVEGVAEEYPVRALRYARPLGM